MGSEQIAFSLVLPAYNEAARLPPYLESIRKHLENRYPGNYEVIVVDDGSGDRLVELLERRAEGWPELRWIVHPQNRGKGAAVRTGMLAARGRLVLFADADGATPIEEQQRLAAAVAGGADLVIGSRLVADAGTRQKRGLLRGLAGRVFAALARRLLGLSVRDTQCGFKMFRSEAAGRIFEQVEEPGYLFDLEVLALAARLGYQTVEVAVNWREVPGGHMRLVRGLPRILLDLWRLRRRVGRR